MNSIKATVFVLKRVNYGEADKIVTALSEQGEKLTYIAKGVRRQKSKLLAGAEVFALSDIVALKGKSDLATLTSAKLKEQFTDFLDDLSKVNLAYAVIEWINKTTEPKGLERQYQILHATLSALNRGTNREVVELWAWANLLHEAGIMLDLSRQTDNQPFVDGARYDLIVEKGGFCQNEDGQFKANHIKLLKLTLLHSPDQLEKIKDIKSMSNDLIEELKLLKAGLTYV